MLCVLTVAFVAAAESGLLVSTADLDVLQDALVVDARAANSYIAGHIPGALHLDGAALSESRGDVDGLLKPLGKVRELLGDAGIDPAKRIVVYSAMDKPSDFTTASRLFWVLEYIGYERVAVLDGGYAKWIAEARKTEPGDPTVKPIVLPEMKPRKERLATAEEVEALISGKEGLIVDARSPDYFRGEKKADSAKQAGHIPGALNLPVESCVDSDSALKSWEELLAIAKTSGVVNGRPVTTYCNTGRSGSAAYFVLRLLGHEHVSMYDGSMSEWTADPSRPVQVTK